MCPTVFEKCVGSLMSPANHLTLKMHDTGPTFYSPYPKRLEMCKVLLTVDRGFKNRFQQESKWFELNLFIRKTIRYTVKQDRLKIIIVLAASQFAQCLALNETSIGEEFSFCKLEWLV